LEGTDEMFYSAREPANVCFDAWQQKFFPRSTAKLFYKTQYIPRIVLEKYD